MGLQELIADSKLSLDYGNNSRQQAFVGLQELIADSETFMGLQDTKERTTIPKHAESRRKKRDR